MTRRVCLILTMLIVWLGATVGRSREKEQEYVEVTCALSNNYPFPGEIIEGILTIKFHKDVICEVVIGPEYKLFEEYRSYVVSGDTLLLDVKAKKGDTKILRIAIKLNDSPKHGEVAGVGGGIRRGVALSENGKPLWPPLTLGNAASGISLKFDEELGRFLPIEEWTKKDYDIKSSKPEYTYDIVGGFHEIGFRPEAEAKKLRAQMDSLKQFDTTLTDEEALEMLHDVEVQMLVRYGIDSKEKSVPILIKARKLMREQNLSKWEAVDKVVEEEKEKGRINFFRPDGSGDTGYSAGSDSTSRQKTDVTLTGTIKYKKHLYGKDTGVDTATVDMALRFVKVYFWAYWTGQGGHFVGPTLTDNNGQFTYTVGGVVLPGARFMPVVFLRGPSVPPGPSGFNRVKVIPDSLRFTWVPSPEDSQTWRYRWGVDIVNTSYYDFGTKYCAEHLSDGGLWPDNPQPKSGAANIYDVLLKAYEYCTSLGDTMFRLAAKWEPGYQELTGYRKDTVYVNGYIDFDPYVFTSADEWADDQLFHEYGHHVMRTIYDDTLPPTSPHYWHESYSERRKIGFIEGWAHLVSARLKDYYNYANDTILIDPGTPIGIKDYPGASPELIASYHNIENPWDFTWSGQWGFDFQKGPWCEGAVAASVWDIYDGYDENWADGRNDTLTMGFAPIWDVFTDPTTIPCWDIYKFWDQWLTLGYNHDYALKEIFAHHGIGRLNPGELEVNGGDKKNDAQWRVEEQGGQRETNLFYIYCSDFEFGPYIKIDSLHHTPGESLYFYTDSTVLYAMPYWYKIGAVDPESIEIFTLPDSGIPFNLPLPPEPPAPVTNLEAFDTPLDAGGSITLTWIKSTDDLIVTNYYIYRSYLHDIEFTLLDSLPHSSQIYVDSSVINGDIFYYYVRAHDGISGSSSSTVWAVASDNRIFSNSSFATAYNNGRKIISNPGGDEVHFVYASDGIYYCYSSDSGKSFSAGEYIGPGLYSSIALDTAGNPCASWVSDSILYYSYLNTYWTSANIVMPVELSQPSMIVDAFDTVHMVLCRYDVQGSDYGDLLYLKLPRTNFEDMVIETLLVNNYCRAPCLAKGFSGDINVLWQGENCLCYQSKDITSWSEIDTIYTTTSNEALHPVIDIYGSTITAVWQDKDISENLQIYSRMKHDNDWETIKQVVSTTGDSRYPSLASSYYCLWQDNTSSNWEVYKSEYIGATQTWAAPENISNSSPGSKYPHGFCTLINGTAHLYALWTEGDASPFEVKVYLSTFTPGGYVLNLDSFPMYEAEPEPGYNEMCGPAVAQMALNYMYWNNITHPDSVPMLPEFEQDLLYTYGIEHNADPESVYFDLQGMWHTIQDKKPMPYAEYGYNFTKRHNTDQYTMLKLICQWIDYTVGTYGGHKDGHPYHVPSIVPAYSNYTNWMAVRGIHTDVAAYPMPDTLIIYGFWVNDPYPASMGGIGENSYKIISDWNGTYYLSMTVGDYIGEYLAVLEPPESAEDCHLILAQPIPRFSPMQMNQLNVMTDRSITQGDINQWIIQAAIDGVTEHLIPYDKKFAELFAMTNPSQPLFAQSMNRNDYYIIPFSSNILTPKVAKGKTIKEVKITTKLETNSGIKRLSSDDKYIERIKAISDDGISAHVKTLRLAEPIIIEGQERIAVVILIDANDGSFKEASWTYTPIKYLPISREQAQQIAFEVATEELGLEIDDINELRPELIHRKSTPYYPEWRIIIDVYAIYISQDGTVFVEEIGEGGKGIGGVMSDDGSFVYSLNAAAPSPFVKTTTISYSIAKPDEVSLNIYDISGRLIKTLVDDKNDAGIYSVRWNGCDNNNRKVATGVYFTRLKSSNFTSVKKVILVR